ncbi:hypothetical protein RO3G_01446 [Rhizopus delemar RA 99-880]|uniref:Uncharacterized protein n=1 Tax=Rhizopus delemar (strain RA 99-880 / ATCC MYA-4621 / FGSC 9543 / NRRL 43880) TaxID=246409 RepID=I1BKL2_RHIO9|nr:hypothetical protein RO3G_01446 [Rhizopus delemar RA 99-880]|eukprot:EIE76742.1 hypothetical protein RO3G_01446 [Rhizopus delemar RA 99-880]
MCLFLITFAVDPDSTIEKLGQVSKNVKDYETIRKDLLELLCLYPSLMSPFTN